MAWITVDEADLYFEDSLESTSWDSIANKSGAINSAFRILNSDPAYVYPTDVSDGMKDANAEYARFLATSFNSKRQNLIEQGVTRFSIGNFSETLKNTDIGYGTNMVLPSIVRQLLEPYEVGPSFIGYFDRPSDRQGF